MSPNIVFTRIDNRLVHGQVGSTWISSTNANLIVVVDDEAATNLVQQQLMRMTSDGAGVGIRFFTTQKTIEIISKASAEQKIFLIAKTPSVIRELLNGNVPIKNVNIGNMHFSEGKKEYIDAHVYVDQKDIEDIAYIKSKVEEIFIQMLPTDRKQVI
ncbi:PTS galactosamine transporter subunit IIB [Anaerorhabdus sp.]|uniref:PTS galactosamine transporter subunit IIB n=1 Tax=Anaerorhabdus sp. TaxID=1872524 RepID=UPI002FC6AA0F